MTRKTIHTVDAPGAIGHYSQAVAVDGWLFMSGQIGLDPATGKMVEGGVEAQTRRVIANMRAILEAAGADLKDVVQNRVYLADMGDFAAFNAIYLEFFGEAPPARATVGVAGLPAGALIEIEGLARLP